MKDEIKKLEEISNDLKYWVNSNYHYNTNYDDIIEIRKKLKRTIHELKKYEKDDSENQNFEEWNEE